MSLENGALGDAEVIALNVMWNRLISVCEEQANALLRVAFGAIVREAGDLSAGVFDAGGRMMAQAVTGTPGHVNTMARSVNAMLAHVPARTLAEGDVLVTNDPWLGAGHVFDFVVVTPVFRGGRIVAYLASTCHVVDVAGWAGRRRRARVRGGRGHPRHPAAQGRAQRRAARHRRHQFPRPARGARHIISLMACNDEGARRLTDLMDEYAIAGLERLAGFIFERSRGAMLDAVAAVPEGVYENTIRLDGYDAPLTLRARMTVGGGRIAAISPARTARSTRA
ncbi:hydantoinase B/oxoprolinase family protein (plasmid) [Paroceanicella profunda]|uniref:Hydantoinase B/oxoprolinase family protein n=1 Tax=Paroceanicella profunda TaxID=2579971 RepID=A0A5B8G4L2_9RHOB|nr:hydantoinase B/oxoprolinase family protein [Paroceanicella profunda]QDL94990.1 hydantoinase B/oxoprolinase family protein [Paroceanicella profunda]